jgi:hypothetical protein
MGNSKSANLKRRERNQYLKGIERERGELERRRKWRAQAAARAAVMVESRGKKRERGK